jgi:hypothetical protein
MRGGAVAGGRRRGRPPDGACCSRRAGLQQCKSFVEMCIVSCLSALPACVCGRGAATWSCPRWWLVVKKGRHTVTRLGARFVERSTRRTVGALVTPWSARMVATPCSRVELVRVTSKLAGRIVLDEIERQVFVVVEVIQDLVVRVTERAISRSLEGSHEDGLQNVFDIQCHPGIFFSVVDRNVGRGYKSAGEGAALQGRLFPNGAEPSLAGQWLPPAGGDGAWAARTGSGPMLMCGDIFAASRGGGAGC